jgi:hypothetical protein
MHIIIFRAYNRCCRMFTISIFQISVTEELLSGIQAKIENKFPGEEKILRPLHLHKSEVYRHVLCHEI